MRECTHTHTYVQGLVYILLWLWPLWLHKTETWHKLVSTSKNSLVHVTRKSKDRFSGNDRCWSTSNNQHHQTPISISFCPFCILAQAFPYMGTGWLPAPLTIQPPNLVTAGRKIISSWRVLMKILDCATLHWFGSDVHPWTNICSQRMKPTYWTSRIMGISQT